MKQVEIYPGRIVTAYQDKDLVGLHALSLTAESLWFNEWVKQGRHDEGTCTLGKGFEVYYLKKGARRPVPRMLVHCNFVQGNVSAYKTAHVVKDYLAQHGVLADYNDGRMD
jgi:hypothetical protein